MSAIKLRMTKGQHHALQAHLLPGDGLEAVAVALAGAGAAMRCMH